MSPPLPPPFAQSGLASLASHWPLWLPVLAGGVAVFLLLPRPRPYPASRGALAGVLALLLAGVLLVRADVFRVETLLFYAFSGVAVVSGALLVTQRNPARAALSFALVVLSSCGLFLLLAAPFLMAATVIIYAGAIIVIFLFVIMLAQQEAPSDADARSREPLLATVTGFLLLAALLHVLHSSFDTREVDGLLKRTRDLEGVEDVAEVKKQLGEPLKEGLSTDYKTFLYQQGLMDLHARVEDLQLRTPSDPTAEDLRNTLGRLEEIGLEARARLGTITPPPDTPLSDLSGPAASTLPGQLRRDPATGRPQLPAENSAYLGRSLFTDFLLPVELGGLLLLVAAIGAIAIAHRRTPDRRPVPAPRTPEPEART
jgi:NADH-quinone oxidoreductase subunit J